MARSRAASGAIGALALLAAPHGGGADEPPLVSADCTVATSRPQRMALSDGTTLTIDVSSMAHRRGEVLIAGTPTYLWPRGSARGGAPLDAPLAFGVVRDVRGRYAVVPAPAVPGAKHPRVVSAGNDGWHAVFVTGSQGTPMNALAFMDAEIWYGRYDGRRWTDVSRIARVHAAELLPGRSSGLVATPSGIAFAYAFDRSAERGSRAAGNQGLVLLRRRGSEWKADTLQTWEGPGDVQLATDTSGVIVAAYTQAYFEGGRPHGPDLFTARFDARWERPRLAINVPSRYVAAPMLPRRVHAGSVIAWQSAQAGAEGAVLEWGVFGHDQVVRSRGHVAAGSIMDRPAMLQAGGASALWLLRDGKSQTSLRLIVARDTTLQDLGSIQVPLDNPTPHAAVLEDGTILIVTGGLGRSPSDPPASSYLTTAVVRCTGARPVERAVRVPSNQ